MSEERENEQAGSPVEQAEATDTQVLAAVERAAEVAAPEPTGSEPAEEPTGTTERPSIAPSSEPPSAGEAQTAEEIFAAHTPHAGTAAQAPVTATEATESVPPESDAKPASEPAGNDDRVKEAESVAPEAAPAPTAPVRDGEIRISADHPMAALYMQSPTPPEMRGNRGAGVLISLLATVAFAILYAGVLALWLAPNYPPSTFLSEGLQPLLLSWGSAAAIIGFFVGLVLLVLIVGRAGWWAYVLGGFLVAAFTWAATLAGFALSDRLMGESVSLHPLSLVAEYGLIFPVIAAALVAREVSVWFGAWIGGRGRRMKRINSEAIAEYEAALAEVQAKQP